MLGRIFAVIGGIVGESMGGGIFSTIGRFAGRALGDHIEKTNTEVEEHYRHRRHLDNLYIAADSAGKTIPIVFGRAKIQAQIIWAMPLKEVMQEDVHIKHFKGTNIERSIRHDTSYSYYATFAVALCAGEITDIGKIWAGGQLMDVSKYNFRLYKGASVQTPDPLIERTHGIGRTPGFRDLAYIVFEEMPLAEFSNKVPRLSFEVYRKCTDTSPCPEDLVRQMVIIPGSGEFVYDTVVQTKTIKSGNVALIEASINSHNYKRIADAVFSLDQMQSVCPNLEWVAPVVCWFGDSMLAKNCTITPRVEFNDEGSNTSDVWHVADKTRTDARVISKDSRGNPNYGGTINDASVLRYLDELKKRHLKIMFYPMFFLDISGKPWRGHITVSPEDVIQFFNNKDGYKNFILHYANLVRGKIDAFVIGSELIGLTKVRSGSAFPAVDALIDIAHAVKYILGPSVIVTYAADWSEYHHTDGGWYNLDTLWSSDSIDIVGIDAYFPITDSVNSSISVEEIKNGWTRGEGYDFYREGDETLRVDPDWAWKNIHHWWAGAHHNPDGQRTKWIPRSKKIWFTEFGFPSIDKASNQPNVFYNPACVDGGVPRHSNGRIDFCIQRKAIRASLERFAHSEFVDKMFLWTWDARPCPAWPHGNFWRDGDLWSRGHWVNNKFGSVTLGSIIKSICQMASIGASDVNVESIDEIVGGMAIEDQLSAIEIINKLRCAYFFDIHTSQNGALKFTKREVNNIAPKININAAELIKQNDHSYYCIDKISQNQKLGKMMINFVEQSTYDVRYYHLKSDACDHILSANLILPLTMTESEVEVIANIALNISQIEQGVITFTLPIEYIHLEPTSLVTVSDDQGVFLLRIANITIKKCMIEVVGILHAHK